MRPRGDFRAVAIATVGVSMLAAGFFVQWLQRAPTPLSYHPDEHLVHQRFQQGVVMLQEKQYTYAVEVLHEVLKVRPTMPEAHANMGYAFLGLENFSAARSFFDAAIELDTGQLNAYYGLAIANRALGLHEEALAAMQVYAHLSTPSDPYLDSALAILDDWQRTREAYRK